MMKLEFSVKRFDENDVISTSTDGYKCSLDQYKSYQLSEAGGVYYIGAYDDADTFTFDFGRETPKPGSYYHIFVDENEVTLTECDNPNHRADD